jgi:hypothetical protein
MKSRRTGSNSSALSPEVEALVAHERVPPPQSEAVRARVLSRAREALSVSPPLPRSSRMTRASVGKTLAAAAGGVALVVGIAAALQLVSRTRPEAPPAGTAPVTAPLPSENPAARAPVPTAPSEAAAAPAADAEAGLDSSTNRTRREASVPSSVRSNRSDGGLDELQLLSRARQADARHDYGAGLALLAEHERNYPAGRLAEEREVLRLKALVGLGRADQARRAATRFRRQFPRSVLLHRVDEMLVSLP